MKTPRIISGPRYYKLEEHDSATDSWRQAPYTQPMEQAVADIAISAARRADPNRRLRLTPIEAPVAVPPPVRPSADDNRRLFDDCCRRAA